MWPGGAWQAATWEAHAVLREAGGDTRRAAALYDEAADRFADLGRPLDRDRCRAAAKHVAGATTAAGWSPGLTWPSRPADCAYPWCGRDGVLGRLNRPFGKIRGISLTRAP